MDCTINLNAIHQHQSSGLQTAWLLATLGSKISAKKSLKSDILNLSIPSLCQELIESNSHFQIRYSSNILYGISLAYRTKVNYCLQDITFIKSQLCKEFLSFKLSNTSSVSNLDLDQPDKKKLSGSQLLLNNDPTFDINFDLVPMIDFIIEQETNAGVKRRKLDIKSLDQDVFPDSFVLNNTQYLNSTTNNTNGLFTSYNQTSITHDEMLDDFLDKTLQVSQDGSDSSSNLSSEFDIEFDEEGQLIDKAKPIGMAGGGQENYNDFIDDFEINQQPILEEVAEVDEQQTRSISNDENFAISNSGELQQQQQSPPPKELDTSQAKRVKTTNAKKHKLITDPIDLIKISSTSMIDSVNNYEINMLQTTPRSDMEQRMLSEIWSVLNDDYNISPYLRFVNRISLSNKLFRQFKVFQNEGQDVDLSNSSFSINSMIKEVANFKRVENLLIPDLGENEIGRDVLRQNEELENSNNDFNADIDVTFSNPDELREEDDHPPSEDIFNISFGSDDSYARSSSRVGTNEQVNEEVDFGLTGSQFSRFFDLLKQRCEKWGRTYLTQDNYNFNKIESATSTNSQTSNEEAQQEEPELQPQQLTRLKFCEFIPNLESSKDLHEASVTRKLAANSFSIILALATKNGIGINTISTSSTVESDMENDDFDLNTGNNIELIVNCN
ncbi:hypothetical protein DFJ63DRAFT_334814 [Scheffersomyces coipomensis]|uniref:uncharacterized protein n=1 Tax=Scheffersomyces coipomensis TaxID=1788519 RepID=UPI00315D24EA